MTYGGRHQWIDMAHRRNPEINWYIFVGAPHKTEVPGHWEDINEKIGQLETLQKGYPEAEKIKYNYIELDFENNLIDLIRYFKVLIESITHKFTIVTVTKGIPSFQRGSEISCNITEGLFEMRLASFIASQLCAGKVKEVYYFNKQSFEKNILLRDLQLPDHGKKFLELIGKASEVKKSGADQSPQVKEFNLSELLTLCVNNKLKLDLPSLSRLVKKLRDKGYVNERREGRSMFVSISDLGRIFCPNEQYEKEIEKKLLK